MLQNPMTGKAQVKEQEFWQDCSSFLPRRIWHLLELEVKTCPT